MAHHNYRLEPNVRFSPDKKIVFFTSNMFGPSYLFGVEVNKASNPSPAEVLSTPELAAKFNPTNPPRPTLRNNRNVHKRQAALSRPAALEIEVAHQCK